MLFTILYIGLENKKWMNTLATDAGLNFSRILQDGIKQKLHLL